MIQIAVVACDLSLTLGHFKNLTKALAMNHYRRLTALSLVVLFSTTAIAGPHGRGHDDDWDRYERDTDTAQVLSARPIYSNVRSREPREECWDERVVYRDEYQGNYSRSNRGVDRTIGTVLGGVIGGALGHQFSEGSGNKIATAIGVVVGAEIGRNGINDGYERSDRGSREQVRYEPRCRTINEARYQQRMQGYDVTYRYRGQIYNTELPYDPGSRLQVQVDVSPRRY